MIDVRSANESDNTFLFKETDQIAQVRSEMVDLIGAEAIEQAHRQRLWLDAVAISLALSLFVASFFFLANFNLPTPVLIGISITQGWLMLAMPLLSHDIFEHRRAWEGPIRDWVSALLFLPTTTPSSVHRVGHYRHHARLGTSEDTESSLACVDSRLKRLLFLTAFGYLLARSGHWKRPEDSGYDSFLGATSRDKQLRKRESILLIGWLALMISLSMGEYRDAIVFGYWIPLIFVAPALVSIRVIIEHAHIDASNPWWIATYYRCGFLTKFLFLADCGDCHLIHHIFPKVPWYNMSRLVEAAHPHLLAKGVKPSVRLSTLIWGWFVKNHTHRTLWERERPSLRPDV